MPIDSPSRRRLALGLAGASLGLPALRTAAQDYPARPIRLVVPTPAGSGPDADARQMAVRLAPLLGQPVVIENRPGAAARIATEFVARSAPDGYTLLVGTPSLATAPALYASLPYDVRRDLVPVSLVSTTAYALTINAAVPAAGLADYVRLARTDAAYANIGTYGIGTIPHLAGAWFGSVSGSPLKFIHYNTTPPFNDLLAGQTQGLFDALLPVMGHVRAHRLRPLAISGRSRHPLFPDTPTFAEAGHPGYDPMVWIGVLAPAGTPQPVVQRLAAAIAQVARRPDIVEQRRSTVSESVGSTPEEFSAFLDTERQKWSAVIQRTGVRLE